MGSGGARAGRAHSLRTYGKPVKYRRGPRHCDRGLFFFQVVAEFSRNSAKPVHRAASRWGSLRYWISRRRGWCFGKIEGERDDPEARRPA